MKRFQLLLARYPMRDEQLAASSVTAVDGRNSSCYGCRMPAVANKSRPKRKNNVMADATDRLLRAAKEKMLKEKGRIDYAHLRRENFSAAMIARLKAL
jgi:hypothetical protein